MTDQRGFLPTATTNGLILVLAVGSSVIASRALGPHGRGEFVAWQVWASTVGILVTTGVPQAVVTLPGDRHALGLRSVALAALGLCVAAAIGGALALLLIHAPTFATGAGALAAAASAFSGIQIGFQQRRGNMVGGFNLARLAPPVAAFAASALVALSRTQNPTTWFAVTATLQVNAIILSGVLLRERRTTERRRSRELLMGAIKLAPVNAVTQVQYRADSLIVAALFPASSVGYYAVASAAGSAVLSIGQAGGMVRFGRRSRGTVAESRAPFLATLVLALLAAVFARPIVALLYGSAFLPAVAAVRLLAFVGFFQSIDYYVVHVAMLHGRTALMVVLKTLYVAVVGLLLVGVAKTDADIMHVGMVVLAASMVVSAVMVAFLVSSRGGAR